MSLVSTRTKFEQAAGHLVFDGATYYSETGWRLAITEELVAIQSDSFGELESSPVGRLVKITGKPQQFTSAGLAKLYPFGAMRMGKSIVGATDKTVDLFLDDGSKMRIPCGFVYKEPAMTRKAGQPILGDVEFWGIAGINADAGALASYLARTSVSYPGDTTWDGDEVNHSAPIVSFSGEEASDLDDIDCKDGVTITPQATLVEDRPDGKGLRNVRLTGYKVTATLEPMNISRALIEPLLGFNLPLGSKKSSLGRDLKIRGDGAYIYLYNAVMDANLEMRFNAKDLVMGQLTFEARSRAGASPTNPLFLVTDEDPDEEV